MARNKLARVTPLVHTIGLALGCLGCDAVMQLTSDEFRAQFPSPERSTSDPPAPQNEQPAPSADYCTQNSLPDVCEELARTTFRSVENRDLGLGLDEDGNVINSLGNWSITINSETGTFRWGYTDVSESGTYTCNEGAIAAQGRAHGPIMVQYDRASCVLFWDGLEYVAADALQ